MILARFHGGPLDQQQRVVQRADYELQCAIPEPIPIASPEPESAGVRVGVYRVEQSYQNEFQTLVTYAWRGAR